MNGMFNDEKATELLPAHMLNGLRLYINHRIEPGSFLEAVLQNNLKEAVGRADHINKRYLGNYIEFLYNYAPAQCWGSVEKYNKWLSASFNNEGENKNERSN